MGRSGVDVRTSSIRVTFTYNGKQERRTLQLNGAALPPTPANIKYAERLAAGIREKIRLGMFVMADYFPVGGDVKQAHTLGDQLDSWLAALRIEESTRAGYESAARFWKLAAGDVPLRALKHSDLLKGIAARADLSGKTINNYVSVLNEALSLAVRDGVIQDNPASGIPRAKHQKDPPDPFSREESGRIIELASTRHPGQVHNLVEFWFWTGMRTSEVFGLTWANVDLSTGTVLVSQANVRGKLKTNTKTNDARNVRLNSVALAAIKRQRQHTRMADGLVFQDPRYLEPWNDERAFRRSFWTPMLKTLEIRYRRPYNMRHSYAAAMLMAGMTPAYCAKQLGHSVDMFLRTYSKWMDGAQNDLEMRRLEATFIPELSPKKTQGPEGP